MQRLIKLIILTSVCLPVYAQTINTIFGDVDEQNPVILAVLESKAMQRLKHIDQSGPEPYFTNNFPTFSRYDHSLGVYALLKRFNVPEKEQIAGLLHDASHTVFSHVGDVVFQNGEERKESYQDSIHAWYLEKMGVDKIIAVHNLTVQDILPENPEFIALEQPYPDMNADRIEYNLHTGIVCNDLTEQDTQDILNTLKYDNNTWYFTDVAQAKRFARLSTYYTRNFWGSTHNIALYTVAAAAIKRAIETGLITKDDFHFGVDADIVSKLSLSEDKKIRKMVQILENIDGYYSVASAEDFDVHQPVKMRGINPYVLHDNALVRLSELSLDYMNDLQNTQNYSAEGVYLKFRNIEDQDLLDALRRANI